MPYAIRFIRNGEPLLGSDGTIVMKKNDNTEYANYDNAFKYWKKFIENKLQYWNIPVNGKKPDQAVGYYYKNEDRLNENHWIVTANYTVSAYGSELVGAPITLRQRNTEPELVNMIGDRAHALWASFNKDLDSSTVMKYIRIYHRHKTELDLYGLAYSSDGDFAHDISGIMRTIDSNSQNDIFSPRYAQLDKKSNKANTAGLDVPSI